MVQTPSAFRMIDMPFDEGIYVWNLGEDIVTENEVCLRPGFSQFARRPNTEELHQRRHTALFGSLGDVRGRIDAEDGNALVDKELQQISVIATEFNHLTRRAEGKSF